MTTGQVSNSFPKQFSYLCEYAIRFDLSCSFCEYPFIFHCLHCSPSCFDTDSLLLAHLWLGLSWVDCISANKRFSSPKTSSRKPYTSSKQQERQKHNVETTVNFSLAVLLLRHDKGWAGPLTVGGFDPAPLNKLGEQLLHGLGPIALRLVLLMTIDLWVRLQLDPRCAKTAHNLESSCWRCH